MAPYCPHPAWDRYGVPPSLNAPGSPSLRAGPEDAPGAVFAAGSASHASWRQIGGVRDPWGPCAQSGNADATWARSWRAGKLCLFCARTTAQRLFLRAQSAKPTSAHRGHVWPVVPNRDRCSHPVERAHNPELRKQRAGSTPASGTIISTSYANSLRPLQSKNPATVRELCGNSPGAWRDAPHLQ